MSEWRRSKGTTRADENEPAIIKALLQISGVTVEKGHDDILVGYKGKTYWYEIKDPAKVFNKDGSFKKGAIKPSQERIRDTFTGHYKIVWSLDMILEDMGIVK